MRLTTTKAFRCHKKPVCKGSDRFSNNSTDQLATVESLVDAYWNEYASKTNLDEF